MNEVTMPKNNENIINLRNVSNLKNENIMLSNQIKNKEQLIDELIYAKKEKKKK